MGATADCAGASRAPGGKQLSTTAWRRCLLEISSLHPRLLGLRKIRVRNIQSTSMGSWPPVSAFLGADSSYSGFCKGTLASSTWRNV